VRISSDDPVDGDLLSLFSIEFRLAAVGNPRRLDFANPQPTGFTGDADYVFSGASSINAVVSATVVPNDTLVVEDFSSEVTVPFASSRLLARLSFTPGPGLLAPQPGDTFNLSVVLGANTFFDNDSTSNIAFTVVPEPSSFAMLLTGGIALLAARTRRFRRR
jgi:hypothetical protein